jgi:histone H1/5
MASNPATMKRLKAANAKAAARAAAAKQQVRSAKAELKQARKLFKLEKKAAKQARRKMDAAAAAVAPGRESKPVLDAKVAVASVVAKPRVRKPATAPKPARSAARRAPKPRARKSPETMRSAAEVAKSVIERLHSPPPVLPTPINSTDPAQPPTAAPGKP